MDQNLDPHSGFSQANTGASRGMPLLPSPISSLTRPQPISRSDIILGPARKKRRLEFVKCDFCRRDKQKCMPSSDQSSDRCSRCQQKDLPCSERTKKPRKRVQERAAEDSPEVRLLSISNNPGHELEQQMAYCALSEKYIRLLSRSLKRDICELRNPGTFVDTVERSEIDKFIPHEVQNACRFWIPRLIQGVNFFSKDKQMQKDVYEFLKKSLLYWLEAMSLMNKCDECISQLESLGDCLVANFELFHELVSLHDFTSDAQAFVLRNRWIMDNAPLQLYYSGLAFAPRGCAIKALFEKEMLALIRAGFESWSTSIEIFEDHPAQARAVAFSPDGKLIEAISTDEIVRLWNIVTGSCLTTLKGHSSAVGGVVFSPDGKLLASASWDETVQLWDVATGTWLIALDPTGHSGRVEAVFFSPDSKLIASRGYWDDTVRVWDVAKGSCLAILSGHCRTVSAVAFSPDGKVVVSASWDGTVRFWDVTTASCRATLVHHFSCIGTIAFSPDGKYLTTDHGIIPLNPSVSMLISPSQPEDQPTMLVEDGGWIGTTKMDLLWVPPEFRPFETIVKKGSICIYGKGRITLLQMHRPNMVAGETSSMTAA